MSVSEPRFESVNNDAHAMAPPCPYCGSPKTDAEQCESCGGLFEPLSKQATQNAMGAWFIRDEDQPFRPGCSLQTLHRLVARGKLTADTVIRGPTTRQFWSLACDTPGVAHLLGKCHNCHAPADADDYMCRGCGAVFVAPTDRQHLGLAPVRLLPGEAPPNVVAGLSMGPPPPLETPPADPLPPSPLARAPFERSPLMIAKSSTFSAPEPRVALADVAEAPEKRPASHTDTSLGDLRRQLGTLRTVCFTLGGVAAALAIAIAIIIAGALSRSGDASSPTAGAPASSDQNTAGRHAARSKPAVPGVTDAVPAARPPSPPPTTAIPVEPPKSAQDWQAARDEAMKRAETGTIEAVEDAVRQLERIRSEAAPELQPATLTEDLAGLNKRLDELNLRKFL